MKALSMSSHIVVSDLVSTLPKKRSSSLPDDFETLPTILDRVAKSSAGVNFYTARGALKTTLSYCDMRIQAQTFARRLASLDLPRNARCCIVANTDAEFLIAFMGCQYAGILPAPLPAKIHLNGSDAYREHLAHMIATTAPSVVLCDRDRLSDLRIAISAAQSLSRVANAAPPALFSHEQFAENPCEGALRPFAAEDDSYIQFSSGSTKLPKGILISQRMIATNTKQTLDRVMGTRSKSERCVSWLPFYHDMGLVGMFLMPLTRNVSIDFIDNMDFIRRPLLWLKLISDHRGTITYAPLLGYRLALRRANMAEGLDLSSLRVAGIGADMIHVPTMKAFSEAFAPHGFDPNALSPSYGMAEATLAITIQHPGYGLRSEYLDKQNPSSVPDATEEERRSVAYCGQPLDGVEISIRDENGKPCSDRQCGQIFIHCDSRAHNYYYDGAIHPVEVDAEGWFDTGDLGYLHDGSLIVTGRAKEMILYHGRNIWPQQLDQIISDLSHPDIIRAACFGVEDPPSGGDAIVAAVEIRPHTEQDRLRKELASLLYQHCGARATIVFVQKRSMSWTSSGKLRRLALRDAYCNNTLALMPPPNLSYQDRSVREA